MSEKTKDLRRLKAAFPNAVLATDEEVFSFGATFVHDYTNRMRHELETFKTAADLTAQLSGQPVPPRQLKLSLELRQGLIDTLSRLSTLCKERANDGTKNSSGNSGQAEN